MQDNNFDNLPNFETERKTKTDLHVSNNKPYRFPTKSM